eukprot:357078-Chlamydomonas_euryale.AAC.1
MRRAHRVPARVVAPAPLGRLLPPTHACARHARSSPRSRACRSACTAWPAPAPRPEGSGAAARRPAPAPGARCGTTSTGTAFAASPDVARSTAAGPARAAPARRAAPVATAEAAARRAARRRGSARRRRQQRRRRHLRHPAAAAAAAAAARCAIAPPCAPRRAHLRREPLVQRLHRGPAPPTDRRWCRAGAAGRKTALGARPRARRHRRLHRLRRMAAAPPPSG